MSALAAIHVAKKQLGLDDDTYRAMLVRVTGKSSTRDMTEAERNRVVAELRAKGFKAGSTGPRKKLEGRYAAKLQALWIAGWNLGIVRDRTDEALIAFVKRQAGVDHVRFLYDPADARRAIEGLKGWLARAGKVDWWENDLLPEWLRCDGAKIAVAQWNILAAAGEVARAVSAFRQFVADVARPVDAMEDRDWIPVMNALGERVRRIAR